MSQNVCSLLVDSLGLPSFDTMEEFEKLTGLSTRLLYCLSKNTKNYYKIKSIPKKNGSLREIAIPSYTLRIIQRWILTKILNKIVPSNRAMAFRIGERYGHKQNAFYHLHTLYGLSIDIKDFFPSIPSNKVYTVFSNIGYSKFAATILTNLCTLFDKLPQGSVCSPALSNIICISLDKRLIGMCEKRGVRYTRYADDMYFSCDDKGLLIKSFSTIRKIVNDEGFFLNDRKTHFHTPSNKKMITGIVVAKVPKEDIMKLKAPKELKRKVRAEIYQAIFSGIYSDKQHILGEISYISFIEKDNNDPYLSRIKKYISDVAKNVQYFSELVEAYNGNLLFTDLMNIGQIDASNISDDVELQYLFDLYSKRKKYLTMHNLADICAYVKWPKEVFAICCEDESYAETEDLPF